MVFGLELTTNAAVQFFRDFTSASYGFVRICMEMGSRGRTAAAAAALKKGQCAKFVFKQRRPLFPSLIVYSIHIALHDPVCIYTHGKYFPFTRRCCYTAAAFFIALDAR